MARLRSRRNRSRRTECWPRHMNAGNLIKLQLMGAAIFLFRQSSDHWMTQGRQANAPRSLSSDLQSPILGTDILSLDTNKRPEPAISMSNTNSYLLKIPHTNSNAQQQSPIQIVDPPPNDLRLDWSHLPEQSALAKRIRNHQTTCPTLDDAKHTRFWIHQFKRNGLGQMLHQWSQTVCNALQANRRVLTRGAFVWMHESCEAEFEAKRMDYSYSPLECYFGRQHEISFGRCPLVPMPTSINDTALVANTTETMAAKACDQLLERDNISVSDFRAASMEWLFSGVSPLVIKQARQQLKRAFGKSGLPPRDHLVTVHVRWGDKAKEMKLKPVQEYIEGVHRLVGRDKTLNTSYPLHVYVASEDVVARKEFKEQAPPHWIIHASGPHVLNRRPEIRQNASGKKGLESMGALLLSLEANYYVLTTKSNWSRLINELRVNVVNPRCNDCTQMIDLIPGEW